MQYHVVSFEGPDGYARAGGLASRVEGLTHALTALGAETHLWFVGDPERPGHEVRNGLHLHRWCQWISRWHPGGVYDGEEVKRTDFTASFPPYLMEHALLPHLERGGEAAVLAEEWHTADATIEIDRRLRAAGRRERVSLLWNANNLFGLDRIAWPRLKRAAAVTTVSRIMRHRMAPLGVEPLVLPNGLAADAFRLPDRRTEEELGKVFAGRLPLVKVARWDPDKDWLAAIRSVARLRDEGLRPLLVARGGAEFHESEVRELARSLGLRWVDRVSQTTGKAALLEALGGLGASDIVCLRFALSGESLRPLFRVADAVLANSRFEPFGLVGLETMAVGGVACTGLSGEDYAIPGRNALVIQTDDPGELLALLGRLRAYPDEEKALRKAARMTARQFSWTEILKRILLPRLGILRSAVATELTDPRRSLPLPRA